MNINFTFLIYTDLSKYIINVQSINTINYSRKFKFYHFKDFTKL